MDVVEQYHQNEYSDTIVQFLRESANRSKELFPNENDEDEINHIRIATVVLASLAVNIYGQDLALEPARYGNLEESIRKTLIGYYYSKKVVDRDFGITLIGTGMAMASYGLSDLIKAKPDKDGMLNESGRELARKLTDYFTSVWGRSPEKDSQIKDLLGRVWPLYNDIAKDNYNRTLNSYTSIDMKVTSREILAAKNKKYVNLDQETLEELMYRPSSVYAGIFKKENDKDLELEF